jgi:hypothetical protein
VPYIQLCPSTYLRRPRSQQLFDFSEFQMFCCNKISKKKFGYSIPVLNFHNISKVIEYKLYRSTTNKGRSQYPKFIPSSLGLSTQKGKKSFNKGPRSTYVHTGLHTYIGSVPTVVHIFKILKFRKSYIPKIIFIRHKICQKLL